MVITGASITLSDASESESFEVGESKREGEVKFAGESEREGEVAPSVAKFAGESEREGEVAPSVVKFAGELIVADRANLSQRVGSSSPLKKLP